MSTRLCVKENTPSTPSPAFTSARAGVLWHKPPFDKAAGQNLERDEEHREGAILQRWAVNQAGPATVLPTIHEVLRSPGRPLEPATRSLTESHFSRDFSRVPIRTAAPMMIQPKLAIGKPGDKYEREADRIAEQVMRMPEPGIQFKPT